MNGRGESATRRRGVHGHAVASLVAALLAATAVRAVAAVPPHPVAPPQEPTGDRAGLPKETVTIAGERFELELAADPRARTTGLMGREAVAADGGMLFVFPRPAYRSFWMAQCVVPIDLIFLDERGAVTALHKMKPEPPRRPTQTQASYEAMLRLYRSIRPAQFAVELREGSIERLGLKRGAVIELDRARLVERARSNEPGWRRP